jgi:hypothetical protein
VLRTPVYNEIKVLILALCLPQTIRFIRRVRDMNLAPLWTEKVPQSLSTVAMYMRMMVVTLVPCRSCINPE